ncbi:MAG: GldG family protein [Planctomycetia bacterium]|nr:GldG family protein [Planctomycetia bacterium]
MRIFGRLAFFAAILVALNLLCHYVFPAQIDLTQRRIFTPAPQTRNLLASLSAPVDVVLLAPKSPRTVAEQNFHAAATMFRDLVATCRQAQPLIRLHDADPAESAAAREWQEQFADAVPPCVLIATGSGPAAGHEVLTARDIAEFLPGSALQGARVDFLGEQALTGALARLSAGRKQSLLYATTGHGELSLDDSDPASPRGFGLIGEMLRQLDCRIAPLDLSAEQRVPRDASLVVVAGGEGRWSDADAEKLDVYLRQGGRALLFVDHHFDARLKRPAPCGLEELIAKFGIAVGNDRVVTRNIAGQVETASPALPAAGNHPLVRSLPQAPLTLLDCRSLSLSTSVRQIGAHVVPLLVSHAAPRAWADADFRALGAPEPGGPDDLDGPVAMAMAVERRQERDAAPALVVVGNAQFASNRAVSASSGRIHASFFLSSVNWLRGRRELLGDIPPQRHEGYRLTGSPADHRGLVWKSSLVLCSLIATAGLTVWTTRRIG